MLFKLLRQVDAALEQMGGNIELNGLQEAEVFTIEDEKTGGAGNVVFIFGFPVFCFRNAQKSLKFT